jgi:hypothetical protein
MLCGFFCSIVFNELTPPATRPSRLTAPEIPMLGGRDRATLTLIKEALRREGLEFIDKNGGGYVQLLFKIAP